MRIICNNEGLGGAACDSLMARVPPEPTAAIP
jgi:hypothetical protein